MKYFSKKYLTRPRKFAAKKGRVVLKFFLGGSPMFPDNPIIRTLIEWINFISKTVESLFPIPWRNHRPITAGWIAEMIRYYFHRFPIRALWARKAKK